MEDTVSALVTYPNARLSFYATNGYSEDSPVLIEIHCENMHLRLEGNHLFCKKADTPWSQIAVEQPKTLGKSYWGAGHIICIADFYNSIQENRPFALELANVEETVRLMLMIYESAAESKSISWEG